MGLIEIADAEIAKMETSLRELRKDRELLSKAKGTFPNAPGDEAIVKAFEEARPPKATRPRVVRDETKTSTVPTVKPARGKPGRKAGEVSLTKRITEWLGNDRVNATAAEIAKGLDVADTRKVSYALWSLSKRNVVENDGRGNWSVCVALDTTGSVIHQPQYTNGTPGGVFVA